MKQFIPILILCFFSVFPTRAQEIVTGTVVDGHNEPVPGVRIEIVGRSETVMTDIDGRFKIDLPAPAKKLIAYYPGYKPMTRDIKPDMIIKLGNGWAGKSSGYRGFIDMGGGPGFGGKINVYAGETSVTDIKTGVSFYLSTTHGYQINSFLFVGVGFGAGLQLLTGLEDDGYYYAPSAPFEIYSLNIPLYTDVRWDFGLEKKSAPFIDLKLGYQINKSVAESWGVLSSYRNHHNGYSELCIIGKDTGGVFLQPTVGMRTRLGSKAGLNLGMSYFISMRKKLDAEYEFNLYDDGNQTTQSQITSLGSSSGGVFMINIGFDF